MLQLHCMQEGESFRLVPPDSAWPTAILFETPEQIYQRVYRALRPRSALPAVEVRFEKFANADNFIRLHSDRLTIRISDLLTGAPASVHESLAFILLSKLLRKTIPKTHAHRYRLYLNRKDVRRTAERMRQARGRKLLRPPEGNFFDLKEIFEEMNQKYFSGLMARPVIGWSLRVSRTRLGHFDASHNAIVISRIFDQAKTPRLALEYVMFHEMLHLEFPVEHSGTRRCVHTPAFKEREKQFTDFEKAKAMLRDL